MKCFQPYIDLKSERKFGVPLKGKSISVVFGLLIGICEICFQFWNGFFIFFCGMMASQTLERGNEEQVSLCLLRAGPDLFSCRMSAWDHKPWNDIFLSLELEFCWNVLLFSPPLSGKSGTCVLWKQHKTEGIFLYLLKSPIICLQVLKPKRTINPDCTQCCVYSGFSLLGDNANSPGSFTSVYSFW